MAELTKKLHFMKNGTEQTAKAYSTIDEAGDNYVPLKIDGVACYAPLGATNDSMATIGRVKKIKTKWYQPLLIVNGIIGGDAFAVSSSHDTSNAFKAFDGDNSSYLNEMNEGAFLIFYNPLPIEVTNIVQSSSGSEFIPRMGNLQFSDDGANWNLAVEWSTPSYSVDVGYHKYWKINVLQKGTGSGNSDFSNIAITANVLEHTYAFKESAKPPYAEVSYTTAGTYTFTVPAGVTRLRVACVGGGAGGWYGDNPNNAGDQGSVNGTYTSGDGGTSSLGSLIQATGGTGTYYKVKTAYDEDSGNYSFTVHEWRPGTTPGSPNGNSGNYAGSTEGTANKVTTLGGAGFALSFDNANGTYGEGGKVSGAEWKFGHHCSGGSGGYNSGYVNVTPGATYTVNVATGGVAGGQWRYERHAYAGASGFVLIAYGGDI